MFYQIHLTSADILHQICTKKCSSESQPLCKKRKRPLIWSRSQSAWAQYVIWPSVPARSHGIHLLRHAGHRSTGKLKQLSGNRVTASTHPMADSPCCKASTLFPSCLSLFYSSQSHERTAAPAAATETNSTGIKRSLHTRMIYITYKHTHTHTKSPVQTTLFTTVPSAPYLTC